MAEKTTVKIFIASSAEVKAEREQCVQTIVQLNKSHKHLHIEPIEWEIDMVQGSQPGFKNIQDAINPKLKESQLAVFIFYSKIGKYTLEEFEFANANKIKLFAYFKNGFSPKKEQITSYTELLDFKGSLNDTVLYEEYDNLTHFENKLIPNLNYYLAENFSNAVPDVSVTALSQTNQQLVKMLEGKEQEIKRLKENPYDETHKINELINEIETIKKELQQSEQIIQQQAKDKQDLEKQLAPQKEHDELKAKALDEVKKANFDEAEKYLKESAKDSIAETASTFYELGKIKKIQLQYAEANDYFELAVKIDSQNSSYLDEAGRISYILGYYEKSLYYHEKTLALEIQSTGEDNPDVAITFNEFGVVYNSKGEYDKAIKYYEKALAIEKKFHGEEYPNIAAYYNNLGSAYNSKGEYDKSVEYYEKALTIEKKNHREESPNIAIPYNNLGLAYNNKGEYDKAIEYYEKALVIDKKFHGEEHPDVAIDYNNLGSAYRNIGEYDKAIGYYKKSLSILKKFLPSNHPNIQIAQDNLALAQASKQ